MKIKSFKISGFRGIPPKDPSGVDVNLYFNNEIKNLLVYAPNAYGKSSIADALVWFFKERVRGCDYCTDYSTEDNAHILLGEQSFLNNGFVELVIEDKGKDYSVRKEFDKSGVKTSENLAGLKAFIDSLSDEIIVLDHDRFRRFVSAAKKEKFATFSSLIGYESLDQFRAGLGTLSQNALTNHLGIKQLDKKIRENQGEISKKIKLLASLLNLPDEDSFSALHEEANKKLKLFGSLIYSDDMEIYFNSSDSEWMELDRVIKQHDAEDEYNKVAQSLRQLALDKNNANPISYAERKNIQNLLAQLPSISEYKSSLDKQVLSAFYSNGLIILSHNSETRINCPLCNSKVDKDSVVQHIESSLESLDLQNSQQIISQYSDSITKLEFTIQALLNRIPNIKDEVASEIFTKLKEMPPISNYKSIQNLNEEEIRIFCDLLLQLNKELVRLSEEIDHEIVKTQKLLDQLPHYDFSSQYNQIIQIRILLQEIETIKEKVKSEKKELKIKNEIIPIIVKRIH